LLTPLVDLAHRDFGGAADISRRPLPLAARDDFRHIDRWISAAAFSQADIPSMKSHSTTILTVRHRGVVAIGGDGQVTVNNTVMKADANKIRRLMDGRVITGFAGATADAFALLERFEAKLKDFPSNVPRAATELAKEWRTDRALRRLEAMMTVVDARHTLLVTGNGDVLQPADGVLGIGSGGNYAMAAARALVAHSSLSAVEIVRTALEIAADIDVYTNDNIVVEEMECET
jgi:ATP-dependent HslUV protease, peptidase subunit HslV